MTDSLPVGLRATRLQQLVRALGTSAAAIALCSASAQAAAFPAGCSGGTGNVASLIAAINSANANGAGPDTVQLGHGCLYTLTAPDTTPGFMNWYGPSGLPAIASDITIEGNGSTIARSESAPKPFRLFFVGADPFSGSTDDYVSP